MTRRALLMPCAALATIFSSAPSATADEPSPDAVENIVVIGERATDAEIRAPTSFVSVIDVTARDAPIETAAEVLAEAVGVQVQRFGGLGGFTTISIRGSSANQVPVFLDGIPLSQAQDQTVNLTDLPLDGLAQIEIYRGTVPVGFGGGGVGGVVNLVTRDAEQEPLDEVAVSYGSFDTRKVVATHAGQHAGTRVLAHVSYLGSKGDFTFFDDNGTPENPTDDTTSTRINNDFDAADVVLKASRELADGWYGDVLQEIFYKDQGVPGPGSTQFARPSLRTARTLTYLRARREGWFDGAVDTSNTLYGTYNLQKFNDPDGNFGARQDTHNQAMLIGLNNAGRWYAPYRSDVSWFAEIAYERFFPRNATNAPLPEKGPEQSRLRTTLSLQDEIALWPDRVAVVPSLRYDHLRDEFSGVNVANFPNTPAETTDRDLWTPAIGAAVRAANWLTVRANIGRFQRAPNFSELFGNAGSVVGNAALRPETAINRDIGFAVRWPAWSWLADGSVEYAYFHNNVDDLISFEQVSPRAFRAFNVGNTRLRGHELGLAAAAVRYVALDLNYTHQDTENRSVRSPEGNQLPLRPADELLVRPRLDHRWGSLYYAFTYLGANPTDRDNFLVVAPRSIHTVGGSVRPLPWLTARVEVANVADADVRDLGAFPLPGLSVFGGLRAVF